MGNLKINFSSNFLLAAASVVFLVFAGKIANAKTFDIDQAHTSATFKISHFPGGPVPGQFRMVQGKFEIDDKTNALVHVEATAKAGSIFTNDDKRDKHLRSEDFFDTTKYPDVVFVSDKMEIKKGQPGKMKGKLTMHGKTNEVVWDVDFFGAGKDPWGHETAAFTATINKLVRQDYGINFNKAFGAGDFLIGNDVKVEVDAAGMFTKPSGLPMASKPSTKTEAK